MGPSFDSMLGLEGTHMAWTAQIVDKRRVNERLHVMIEYTNGVTTYRDEMVSRSGQGADWIASQVEKTLADLAGVDALGDAISLGAVAPVVVNPATRTPREKYADKLAKFNAYLGAMRQGIVAVDRPEFLTLKQWLTDNFQDSFVDLFL